jgi:hypothetical protein
MSQAPRSGPRSHRRRQSPGRSGRAGGRRLEVALPRRHEEPGPAAAWPSRRPGATAPGDRSAPARRLAAGLLAVLALGSLGARRRRRPRRASTGRTASPAPWPRANPGGSGATRSLITGLSYPRGVAVAGATSTGPTTHRTRSGGPASTAPRRTSSSSRAPAARAAWPPTGIRAAGLALMAAKEGPAGARAIRRRQEGAVAVRPLHDGQAHLAPPTARRRRPVRRGDGGPPSGPVVG